MKILNRKLNVVIVAGASGIGREIAAAYDREKCNVFVCDISDSFIQSFTKDYPNITKDDPNGEPRRGSQWGPRPRSQWEPQNGDPDPGPKSHIFVIFLVILFSYFCISLAWGPCPFRNL